MAYLMNLKCRSSPNEEDLKTIVSMLLSSTVKDVDTKVWTQQKITKLANSMVAVYNEVTLCVYVESYVDF